MKTWEKPVLVILARTSNEVVLTACKSPDPGAGEAAPASGTPADYYGACMYQLSANYLPSCGPCQGTDAS